MLGMTQAERWTTVTGVRFWHCRIGIRQDPIKAVDWEGRSSPHGLWILSSIRRRGQIAWRKVNALTRKQNTLHWRALFSSPLLYTLIIRGITSVTINRIFLILFFKCILVNNLVLKFTPFWNNYDLLPTAHVPSYNVKIFIVVLDCIYCDAAIS